ncbi:MAG: XdhC family protein [Spirochaetaceae bacterium]|nr:XdhC family protein [Spirochaetaceae bacterium]
MSSNDAILVAADGREPAALAVVVATAGSVPRRPGSMMLVYPDGRSIGTVGGGPVEAAAVAACAERASSGGFARITVELRGEKAVGDRPICGGTATLAVFAVSGREAYAGAAARLGRGERAAIVVSEDDGRCVAAIGPDGAPSPRGYVPDADALAKALGSGDPAPSERDGTLYVPLDPPDRLLVLGGGHVGRALARLAADLDFAVCVADERPEYADPSRFPPGTETRVGRYADIVAEYPFGPATYAVVVSPSHSSDLECVRAILAREYRYAGFIGSRRKTRMILEQAVSDGFPPDKVAALRAPIGADIGAETPAEIAVAILAEIVAVRRGSPAVARMDGERERRRR